MNNCSTAYLPRPENTDNTTCKINALTRASIDHVALDYFVPQAKTTQATPSASHLPSVFFVNRFRDWSQPNPEGERCLSRILQ